MMKLLAMPDWVAVRCLLLRYWLEYKQMARALIMRDLMDRLLFLLAFGFGLGGVMAAAGMNDYVAFLVPGIMAANGLFIMTMAMTFGVYERFNSTRVWQSWLAAPVRVRDILAAELLYASVRTLPSMVILLVLAWGLLGALPSPAGALVALPLLLLVNLMFGAVALCFTVHTTRTLYFAYINTLWTTPMYLFSGVFVPLEHAPRGLQILAEVSPLTHVVRVVRELMLGTPLHLAHAALTLLGMLVITLLAYAYACWAFEKRLLT
jgi:lipooligosaccharide transport system permease protein